jgi:hypothetical protein
VWFERSAHMPNTEEKDKFNDFMIQTLLPALGPAAHCEAASVDEDHAKAQEIRTRTRPLAAGDGIGSK